MKNKVRKKIQDHFKEKINEASTQKSKVKYLLEGIKEWNPGKRAQYMNQLTRKQVSRIFKARSRMIKVKSNFRSHFENRRNGHNDIKCRACNLDDETQNHIFNECKDIHRNEMLKTEENEYFSENTDIVRKAAKKNHQYNGKTRRNRDDNVKTNINIYIMSLTKKYLL